MRLIPAAIVTVTLLTIAGCGGPTDDEPRAIPSGQVQFDLLAPSTTAPPTTNPADMASAEVFMLNGDKLVPVRRVVAAPVSVGTVLATLVQGPNDAELGEGLASSVNPQTRVLGAQTQGTTAIVDISDAFTSISVRDQIRALAQVVYTATAIPGVDAVQVQVGAAVVDVPRSDGSTARGPITRNDYLAFEPEAGR